MHVSANGIDAGDSEQPQNDEYYKNGPKHKFDLLVFKQVSCAAGIQPYDDGRFFAYFLREGKKTGMGGAIRLKSGISAKQSQFFSVLVLFCGIFNHLTS